MDRLAVAECRGCLDAARTRASRPSHPSMSPESEPEFQPIASGLAISERRNAARAGNDDDCRRNTRSGGLLDNPIETRRSPHRRSSVEPQGHTKPISQRDGRPPVYETNPMADSDAALTLDETNPMSNFDGRSAVYETNPMADPDAALTLDETNPMADSDSARRSTKRTQCQTLTAGPRSTKRTQWPTLTPRAGLRNEPNVKL